MDTQQKRKEIRLRLQEVTVLEPRTEITLGDTSYQLEFNNFANRGILSGRVITDEGEVTGPACGINLLEGFDSKVLLSNPEVLVSLLYWGLKTHAPEVTEGKLDKLITRKRLVYITSRIEEALSIWFPDLSDMVDDKPADEGKAKEGDESKRPLVLMPSGSGTKPLPSDSDSQSESSGEPL